MAGYYLVLLRWRPLQLLLLSCALSVCSVQASALSGVEPDLDRTRADAEAGQAVAQWRLGKHYTASNDHTNAVTWYRKAADQGLPKAQLALAACYATGRGVAKNMDEAVRLSRLASVHGPPGPSSSTAVMSPSLPPLPPGFVWSSNRSVSVPSTNSVTAPQNAAPRSSRVRRAEALSNCPLELQEITAAVQPAEKNSQPPDHK